MKAAFNTDKKEVDTTKDIEIIYSQYSDTVLGYLMRMCGNEELAHELAQETFCRAIKSINRFDGKSNVGTWLCSIAKHLYYDTLRRQKPVEQLTDNLPSSEEHFTEQICLKDQAMVAHRMLHRLEEPYPKVFTLRTFCDLTHAEIAELFDKSESWSRVTYYRAKRLLQEAMKENDDGKK